MHAARAGGIAGAAAVCAAFSLPVAVPCAIVATAVTTYVLRGGTIPPGKVLYAGWSVGREPVAKFIDD